MLKTLAYISAAILLGAAQARASTAYEALGVLKKARGEEILKQLVEVRGETGEPQPQSWTILMADPTARGGIREFVVTDGEIASERTPVRGYTVGTGAFPVINFGRLNVDSNEVFKVANKQSVEAKVGFHSVDYTLRTNDADGSPMWVLHLFDYMGAPVGTLSVSAENGATIAALRIDPDARQKPVAQVPPRPTPKPKVKTGTVVAAAPSPTPVFKGGVFGFVERTSK
ncbi:MAG: hypothetical protein ACREKL_08415, partial [Chthoniobacterales bacterium]